MAKVNFTASRVREHVCPTGKAQAFLWDSGASGLGLRATANGSRSYIWQGVLHGRTIRATIGSPKDWGIDEARDEARRLQRLVDSGKDPREDAADRRTKLEARQAEARRGTATVGEAWATYVDHLKTSVSPKTRKPRSERYIGEHLQYVAPGGAEKKRGSGKTRPGLLYPLMRLKLPELTAAALRDRIEAETAGRPTAAAYSFRMLRAFVGWCGEHEEYAGLIPADAVSSKRVTGVVPVAKPKADDCLQREHLALWFAAARELDPIMSTYLQGLLLTGPRREELAALRWDDVDFRWHSVRIRDKVEGERTVPLCPSFESLLLGLKRINDTPPNVRQLRALTTRGETWRPSVFVFASKTAASGHISDAGSAHERVLTEAGLPHVSLHGLRRSFGTLAEWCEVPVGVVAQIQGHKPSALAEKHYRRRPIDLLRLHHTRIEKWMLEQAGVGFDYAAVEQNKPNLALASAA